MSRFCPLQGFSLDSCSKTSANLGIQHWASVGPCEYLKLKGEVVLLRTHSQESEPKWSEWCRALGFLPTAPQFCREDQPAPQRVILAPGSGSTLKNWPMACFAQVLDVLQSRNVPFTVVFGPVEQERGQLKQWQSDFPKWSNFYLPCKSLEELMGLLSSEVLYVGCDSGPGHLAALCGCRGLIIFQKSHPLIWQPWSERFTSIGGMDSPPLVQDVLRKILAHFQSTST